MNYTNCGETYHDNVNSIYLSQGCVHWQAMVLTVLNVQVLLLKMQVTAKELMLLNL
jgi:hypothetical protein